MKTPADLFSKARRPVKTEREAAPVGPPTPVVRERVVHRTFNADGSVTIREFIAGRGEVVRTIPAEEVVEPALTDAQREGARVVASL